MRKLLIGLACGSTLLFGACELGTAVALVSLGYNVGDEIVEALRTVGIVI